MNEFEPTFSFKRFAVTDRRCGMKVGTDGVLLGSWAAVPQGSHTPSILDVGAGCGLIALMLAQRFPDAIVIALEIDSQAIEDAKANIAQSPWADRIKLLCSDFRDAAGSFDLIVSNPPFFTNGESAPVAARAAARHAAALSPLSLVQWAAAHLTPSGLLAMIAPSELSADIEMQAALSRLNICRKVDVNTSRRRGITRTLWELSPSHIHHCQYSVLTVNSPEYAELTKDFYLHY